MNIKIILNQPYPHGMACTNRIHHYAKGLIEQGNMVEIIVPIPIEQKNEAKNLLPKGMYDGVVYYYSNNTTTRSSHFFVRRIQDLLGPILALINIIKEKEKPDAILLVSTYVYHILVFKIFTQLFKITYLNERSEIPFAFRKEKGGLSNIIRGLHNAIVFRLFDGIIVISNNLERYFNDKISSKTKLLIIPVLVSLEEFSINYTPKEGYIAYTGNLSDFKDGIYSLIKSFAIVAAKNKDIKFYIIGKGSLTDKEKVRNLIKTLQLEDRIVLTGYIEREEMIKLMIGAKALVLAKPNTPQATFCFPSKLGEYLSTGNPVITTNVGEIPIYLQDEKNALLTSVDNPEDFAKKLLKVIEQPDFANEVGRNGKMTAENHFDYKRQGKNLSNFIASFSSKKIKKS